MRKNNKKHINFLDGLSEEDMRDSDADGLVDEEERRRGTNPHHKDTDRDGLGDLEEVIIYDTDPNDPDTDRDGMSDGEEVRKGRNPKGPGKLKDLFLAHEGNDYRPHVFHPKRLMFYSVSAIGIKALVVAVIIFFPLSAWLTPDILSQKSRKVVDLTNQFRAQEGVEKLEEDETLQQSARDKCRHMLVEQYFDHVGPDGKSVAEWLKSVNYPFSVAGENLAMGFNRPEELVKAWKESKTHRKNLLDPEYEEIGVAMMSGAYEGSDTTFAAQHFGAPSFQTSSSESDTEAEDAPEDKITPTTTGREAAVAGSSDTEEVSSTTPTSTEAEAEQATSSATSSLPRPVLQVNSPLLTNNKTAEVSITAPEAEKVRIYSEDKKIKTVPLGVFKNITTEVELFEGKNRLQVESLRENRSTTSLAKVVTVDLTPPDVGHSATQLTVDEPAGEDSVIITAQAELSEDTREASIGFAGHQIRLDRTGPRTWQGQKVLPQEKKQDIFDPVIPATLTATDNAGSTVSKGIGWENVEPLRTSLLKQYFLLKSNPSQYLKPLLDVTSIYYSVLLALACLILAINIIIDIRRQKGHVVLSAVGFSALLIVLIAV